MLPLAPNFWLKTAGKIDRTDNGDRLLWWCSIERNLYWAWIIDDGDGGGDKWAILKAKSFIRHELYSPHNSSFFLLLIAAIILSIMYLLSVIVCFNRVCQHNPLLPPKHTHTCNMRGLIICFPRNMSTHPYKCCSPPTKYTMPHRSEKLIIVFTTAHSL